MRIGHGAALLCAMSLAAEATPAQAAASPTLAQLLAYPFVSDLVAAEHADRIAWVETVKGVRNVWAASEYQDVLAGAHYLQKVSGVDPTRIGIWGGSYGGYLTGLALARNSDLFKAGVDFHGVHDWSQLLSEWVDRASPSKRYEQGDWNEALKTAFASSPDADVKTWRSPVLLIQGDDDRNVPFHQTVDLSRRLESQGVDFEELVIPNEIHGFLRYASWLRADEATVDFLRRKLAGSPAVR